MTTSRSRPREPRKTGRIVLIRDGQVLPRPRPAGAEPAHFAGRPARAIARN